MLLVTCVERSSKVVTASLIPCLMQMHVDSWFHLGVMHLNGLGVKTNMQQALNYFASAAKYGHVLAQYNLAMLHLQNSATEKCVPWIFCDIFAYEQPVWCDRSQQRGSCAAEC